MDRPPRAGGGLPGTAGPRGPPAAPILGRNRLRLALAGQVGSRCRPARSPLRVAACPVRRWVRLAIAGRVGSQSRPAPCPRPSPPPLLLAARPARYRVRLALADRVGSYGRP